ncbi:MAG: hypothetical protein V3T05_08455, partial [Myxococcota bacterium]
LDTETSAGRLIKLASLQSTFPALDRPIKKQLAALLGSGPNKMSTGDMLRLATRMPQMQAMIVEPVLGGGAEPLVEVMTRSGADPCGMVPPIWTGNGPAITRVGEQMTYVFFKDGIETFVIRPGFSGKVDNFGMLIPFPSPPAIRKVPDEIFDHIAAAIHPPDATISPPTT